jgi:hypothetical protein
MVIDGLMPKVEHCAYQLERVEKRRWQMRFIGSRVKMIESSWKDGKKKEIKLQAVASIMPGSLLCFNNVPAGAILTAFHPTRGY